MPLDDPSLQELIVRALTGQDRQAQQSLADAAAKDPELRKFCDELDEVVSLLAGSKEWRKQIPSAELTEKVRQAVVSKLPSAPPHFRTVMMESDLGRRRSMRWILFVVILLAALLAAALAWKGDTGAKPKLDGKVVYEAPLKGEPVQGWERFGSGNWDTSGGGLHISETEDPGAYYIKSGFDAGHALAFEIETKIPELDDRSTVSIFIADSAGAAQPSFSAGARPVRALSLEIGRDGLTLSGPDEKNSLLHSKPLPSSNARFYKVRLEYLGPWVRVMVNNESFFEQMLSVPQGPLYPGVRVAGPKKESVFFNAAHVER